MPTDPYAEFGGSAQTATATAPPPVSDPYSEFGGKITADYVNSRPPMPKAPIPQQLKTGVSPTDRFLTAAGASGADVVQGMAQTVPQMAYGMAKPGIDVAKQLLAGNQQGAQQTAEQAISGVTQPFTAPIQRVMSGDVAGGLGQAAPVYGPLLYGAAKGAPSAKVPIGKAAGFLSDVVDPDITGIFSPRLAYAQKALGRAAKVLTNEPEAAPQPKAVAPPPVRYSEPPPTPQPNAIAPPPVRSSGRTFTEPDQPTGEPVNVATTASQAMTDAATPKQQPLGNWPAPKGDPYASTYKSNPQMEPVQSTNINRAGFDAARNTMVIEFKSGAVYQATGIPKAVYEKFQSAESQGSFWARNIKGRYPTAYRGNLGQMPKGK